MNMEMQETSGSGSAEQGPTKRRSSVLKSGIYELLISDEADVLMQGFKERRAFMVSPDIKLQRSDRDKFM
jgi:hypothetical protein